MRARVCILIENAICFSVLVCVHCDACVSVYIVGRFAPECVVRWILCSRFNFYSIKIIKYFVANSSSNWNSIKCNHILTECLINIFWKIKTAMHCWLRDYCKWLFLRTLNEPLSGQSLTCAHANPHLQTYSENCYRNEHEQEKERLWASETIIIYTIFMKEMAQPLSLSLFLTNIMNGNHIFFSFIQPNVSKNRRLLKSIE